MRRDRLILGILFGFLLLLSFPQALLAESAADDYHQGLSLYQQGKFDQAIQQCQAAVQLNPNLWQAYQVLSFCYYHQKDNDQALQACEKSLQLNPDNPPLRKFHDRLVQLANPTPSPTPQISPTPTVIPPSPTPTRPEEAKVTATETPVPTPQAQGEGNPNLPKEGKIIFEIGNADWIGSWNDINQLYGNNLTTTSAPIGAEFNAGAAYALSPSFLVGVRLQYLAKESETVTVGLENYQFQENAFGAAAEAEAVLPLQDGMNFLGTAKVGYYFLVGSSLQGSGSTSGTENLDASSPGGRVGAGVEFLLDPGKTLALDMGLDYQILSFSPVTATPTGNGSAAPAFTLTNLTGGNGSVDFSGIGVFAGLRVY